MTPTEYLGAQNAILNGASALLILFGRWAILQKRRELHRRLMLAALTASALFLASYLTRVMFFPVRPFAGTGMWRGLYFLILFSHMGLAALVPPLALYTLFLASRKRFQDHRRWAR